MFLDWFKILLTSANTGIYISQVQCGMNDRVATEQTQGARTPIGVSGNSLLYILAQDHWNLKILVSVLLWGEETRKG